MLTQETKRKIDNARDILVGKIPDPKQQIEQITIALIYKFMDDMDKDAEEMGGKARFFTNGYEKYTWSKLLDKKLSGQERLDLYVDAIAKMYNNPHIPQLFRDVFKGAFLPYRSPETLSLFLKEIDGFSYEHSEDLGDAFEYLLSIMSAQGDAGQFRTPRHIIDFIVEVVDPQKTDTILDPACGTAGFLISAYKHILKQNREKLTPDEKKKLMKNLVGYDISPDMVKLSLVNMYLHGFPEPKIQEYDTLSDDEKWDENFDVMVANPPFMTPKGGIKPHKRFSVQANRSEVLFVDYILEHLNQKGRAGIIVPEGIIFQSGNAYKQLRRLLVEDGLYAVVSLPRGVFNPYSGVKTSILFFDNELSKKTKEILFIKISNDGYDLGAQRKPRPGLPNDIFDKGGAIDVLKAHKIALQTSSANSLINKDSLFAWVVKKDDIAKDGQYNLSGDRYKESSIDTNKHWPMFRLDEVCDFVGKGARPASFATPDGSIPFIVSSPVEKKCNLADHNTEALVIGDGGSANIHYVNGQFSASDHTYILKNKDSSKVLLKYLYLILVNNLRLIEDGFQGQGLKNVAKKYLKAINIPLPPIDVQRQIVEELNSYHEVVKGAEQIINNYKILLSLDSEWPNIELNELSKFVSGGTPSRSKDSYWKDGNIKWISAKHISNDSRIVSSEYITEEGLNNSSTKIIKSGDIILVTRVSVGKIAIADDDYAINQDLAGIIANRDKINPKFLFIFLASKAKEIEEKAQGMGVKGITRSQLGKIKVPTPSLEKQNEIIGKFEEEQNILSHNKKLIKLFKQKIKDKISKVWK